MVKRFLLILTALAGALSWSPPVAAAPTQVIGNAWKLCDAQVARAELRKGIPQHLMKAISLAETGRWDSVRQANVAWPWTVTALGKGHYFPSKDAALKYVRRLKTKGITNIDVGCMQINLFYHGGAFASLEHAMDPAVNVDYAAGYLEGLYRTTRSWTKAAGYYHSTTPQRARAYKLKVLKYWNQERRIASTKDRKSIDRARMAKLNASHKAQKQAALNSRYSDVRGSQLAAWRSNNPGSLDMATLATMRRASKQAQWREKYYGNKSDKNGKAFAEKRRRQLSKWRKTRTGVGKS